MGLKKKSSREIQYYRTFINDYEELGPISLGINSSFAWRSDPKHLGIMLARYKFVGKMLSGSRDVIEIGCGDGIGTMVVAREVGGIRATDFNPAFIEHCRKLHSAANVRFAVADVCEKAISPAADAAYAVDVIEHVPQKNEKLFFRNLVRSLKKNGVCIIGTPSRESQVYASRHSRITHVNCKSGNELKDLMRTYFENVFLFSMNDEVVHTGFYPMAHYLWALCTGPKTKKSA